MKKIAAMNATVKALSESWLKHNKRDTRIMVITLASSLSVVGLIIIVIILVKIFQIVRHRREHDRYVNPVSPMQEIKCFKSSLCSNTANKHDLSINRDVSATPLLRDTSMESSAIPPMATLDTPLLDSNSSSLRGSPDAKRRCVSFNWSPDRRRCLLTEILGAAAEDRHVVRSSAPDRGEFGLLDDTCGGEKHCLPLTNAFTGLSQSDTSLPSDCRNILPYSYGNQHGYYTPDSLRLDETDSGRNCLPGRGVLTPTSAEGLTTPWNSRWDNTLVRNNRGLAVSDTDNIGDRRNGNETALTGRELTDDTGPMSGGSHLTVSGDSRPPFHNIQETNSACVKPVNADYAKCGTSGERFHLKHSRDVGASLDNSVETHRSEDRHRTSSGSFSNCDDAEDRQSRNCSTERDKDVLYSCTLGRLDGLPLPNNLVTAVVNNRS